MPAETNATSFVVRFVQEITPDFAGDRSKTEWHGTIKHVQTNTEQYFTSISEAVAFMASYVNIEAPQASRASPPHRPGPEVMNKRSPTTESEQP
jgi:hypothetical protein